jgi:hypothetical protein
MATNSRADRAKLFLPFDALTGLKEALKEKERVVIEKKELNEEEISLLNESLTKLHKGDMVKARYFDGEAYIEIEGLVSQFNPELRYLVVVKTKISFEDLLTLNIV